MSEEENMLKKDSESTTFVIQVQYMQKSTWQGKILWVEKNKTQYFRSALEMLTLMESALQKEQAKSNKRKVL